MSDYTFRLGSHAVGNPLDPYIIAEIGVNHEGNIGLAKRLIDEAIRGGAHAAKFQTYKAEKIASKNSPAYWDTSKEPTESQYKLFKKFDSFSEDEYVELANYCHTRGIDFVSTPFDLDAIDFLSPLVPFFKIASADITNVPLIRRCAETGKPLVLSTGAATLPEIEHALGIARAAGASDIALLHCVLNYPTPLENANLACIKHLARIFPGCTIGYSDHVVPDETISALEVAVLFGASILEKHFTHDKTLQGNDHYHAMDADDLQRFIIKLGKYRAMIGDGQKTTLHEGSARLHARRSIVAAQPLPIGHVIGKDDIIAKRPGHGISPIHWDEIIGCVVTKNIGEDELISWQSISTEN